MLAMPDHPQGEVLQRGGAPAGVDIEGQNLAVERIKKEAECNLLNPRLREFGCPSSNGGA
jgi:hypothetical protein